MPLPNSGLVHPRFHEELQRSAIGDAGLPDHGTFSRPAAPGAGEVNEDLDWEPSTADEVYVGALRVQPEPTQDSTTDVGDQLVTLHRYRASISASAPQILVNDVLVLDASADAQLIGRPLVVRDVHYDTFLVRRYLLLEDHPQHATPEP